MLLNGTFLYDGETMEYGGAALQGVNAEMHLVYNAANLATSKQGVSNMLKALAATGLQVRLSGLDMIMTDAGGLHIKLPI